MMPESDQPQCESATIEPTVEPIPPRYWWLKRIALAAGFLFVALFALRLWWGWEANRRLQAEIDKIIAKGEPIYPEDFDPKEDIPDDQNAARFLRNAEQAINLTPEQVKLIDELRNDGKFTAERQEQARVIVESNSVAFELIRRARHAPRADWGVHVRSPVFRFFPATSGQRQLSRLLSLSIRHHHVVGDDKTAVEQMRDALALARAVGRMPGYIPVFVGMGADSVVFESIEAVSSTLNIQTDSGSVQPTGHPCTRADVEALLQELLHEHARREAMMRAEFFERMSNLDIVQVAKSGTAGMMSAWGAAPRASSTPGNVVLAYLITPLVEMDGVTMIRDSTLRLQAAAESNWVGAKRVLPKEHKEAELLGNFVHFLSRIFTPPHERLFLLHFRSLASRHLAGTALAIRLYQVDHGHRPSTLVELVPEYLPEVPLDPFAGDGSAIRYLPRVRPALLYSVGPNGVDDGGKFAFRSGGIDWDQLDMPFFVDGNRPTKPEDVPSAPESSIQAGEDQIKTDGDEGEADEDGEGDEEP